MSCHRAFRALKHWNLENFPIACECYDVMQKIGNDGKRKYTPTLKTLTGQYIVLLFVGGGDGGVFFVFLASMLVFHDNVSFTPYP